MYWRLLSSDPEAARSVVLAEKPVIAQDTSATDPRLLQTLLGNLSTLSSVYHRRCRAGFWKILHLSAQALLRRQVLPGLTLQQLLQEPTC